VIRSGSKAPDQVSRLNAGLHVLILTDECVHQCSASLSGEMEVLKHGWTKSTIVAVFTFKAARVVSLDPLLKKAK